VIGSRIFPEKKEMKRRRNNAQSVKLPMSLSSRNTLNWQKSFQVQ